MLQTTDDRQTDRQTDGRRHIANVNVSSRSLKTIILLKDFGFVVVVSILIPPQILCLKRVF